MRTTLKGWTVLVLLLGTMTYSIAEEITLTTYYPSPRGVYQELRTTNNTYLAIDGGDVGIGTTNPQAKLDVAGAIQVQSGYLQLPTSSSPPSSPVEGMIYFDNGEKRYKGYQKDKWVYMSDPNFIIVTESWSCPGIPGTCSASNSCPSGYTNGGCNRLGVHPPDDYRLEHCQCYTEGASCGTVMRKCY